MDLYWISIILSFVPGFAWMFFYLEEDPRPEPKIALTRTFIYGAAIAFFTLIIQLGLRSIMSGIGIATLSPAGIILFAFCEEIFKFLAAYISVHKDPSFDEPVDAMIHMIVAALGFATIENLGAIGGQPSFNVLLEDVVQTTALRFAGATLLHTLSSAIIGYYWAMAILHLRKVKYLGYGFILATSLHAVFNYFIIIFGNLSFSVVFAIMAGFFVLNDFEKLNNERVNI